MWNRVCLLDDDEDVDDDDEDDVDDVGAAMPGLSFDDSIGSDLIP